jgi:hypothetical protein
MVAKIERDYVAADLAAVESLLKLAGDDPLALMGLESRRDELKAQLGGLQAREEVNASAAIFFSGRPVIASRGIESEFGTQAINRFQDIVTKVYALQHAGSLGQRGIVAGKDLSKLHITNVVHGSFGFQLEELGEQSEIVKTTLKEAVDETTRLIDGFGEEDEKHFADSIGDLDERVLATIKNFFDLVNTNEAAFRLVSDHFDKSFDRLTIGRAVERGRTTRLSDAEKFLDGTLTGALPNAGQFEYTIDAGRVISGRISLQMPDEDSSGLIRKWYGQPSRIKVQNKQLLKGEEVVREHFTLLEIEARDVS